MGSRDAIVSLRDALKLANSIEAEEKIIGLQRIRYVLSQDDSQLIEYGYDKVLFRELLKFIKFDEGDCLKATLDLVESYYSSKKEYQDDIMENLLYRYGLSTNHEISSLCLEKISSLVDFMDDNIAKHAKQIIQMADIRLPDSLNEQVEALLRKIKPKLPIRKS